MKGYLYVICNSSAMRQKDIKYCVGACSLNSILYLFGIWRSATARKLCFSTVFKLKAELLPLFKNLKYYAVKAGRKSNSLIEYRHYILEGEKK